ncbi:MAG TPA: beta-ketoacyl synthase N-terminal-like domain-containing protein [Chthoniobacterales bacterium]
MSAVVLGTGAVTPAGATAAETWRLLLEGYAAPRAPVPQPLRSRTYNYCAVPEKFVRSVTRQPRLRRSGNLSLLGAVAAFDALNDAGVEITPEFSARCAVVYGVSSGGVQYTRRFYHGVVAEGAQAASPLLFPETVFNAPASHLAALLGVDGQSYTLVGDSAVGMAALHFAGEILQTEAETDYVLVVGTEEVDWLLPDAFGAWRLISRDGHCEVYGKRTGTVFGEGAAAMLLAREGEGPRLIRSHPGQSFFSQADAVAVTPGVLREVLAGVRPDAVIASANGTFVDGAEREAFLELDLTTPVYAYKPALGEALGAAAVLQAVLAVRALRQQALPGTLAAGSRCPSVNRQSRELTLANVLVTAVGFNQQVGAMLLSHEQP